MVDLKKCLLAFWFLVVDVWADSYKAFDTDYLLAQLQNAKTEAEKLPLLISLTENYEQSDVKMLLRYAEQVIDLAKRLDDHRASAAGHSAKARAYSHMGEFEQAIDFFMMALDQANVSKDQNLLYNIRGSLGTLYYQLYQNAKAREHYRYALKLAEVADPSKRDRRVGAMSLNLANIHLELEEFELAEAGYTRALNLFTTIEYDVGIVDTTLNLAVLYSAWNSNWDKALPHLEKALALNADIDHPRNKIHVLNSFADYHLYKKQYDRAIEYANQVIVLSRDIDAKDLVALGENTLSVIYKAQKDYEKALLAKSAYDASKEKLLSESTIAKIVEIETQIRTEAQREKISEMDSVLDQKAVSQRYILLVAGVVVLFLGLIVVRIYIQKRSIKNQFLGVDEENKTLKQSNDTLKAKLLRIADEIEQERPAPDKKESIKYAKSTFRKEEKQRYIRLLLDIMEVQRPYRNADLTLGDLAGLLDLTTHQLSELLNESIGQSFHDFVNMYRVEEAKLLMSAPESRKNKILDIAFEAGFSSKASFNRIFKSVVGTTPSAYRKSLGFSFSQ